MLVSVQFDLSAEEHLQKAGTGEKRNLSNDTLLKVGQQLLGRMLEG
jgi:hypothetical protein